MHENSPERLLRLPDVLARFPISKSSLYARMGEGRFPRPIRLGARTVAWRESQVQAVIEAAINGDAGAAR